MTPYRLYFILEEMKEDYFELKPEIGNLMFAIEQYLDKENTANQLRLPEAEIE